MASILPKYASQITLHMLYRSQPSQDDQEKQPYSEKEELIPYVTGETPHIVCVSH